MKKGAREGALRVSEAGDEAGSGSYWMRTRPLKPSS